MKLLHLKHLGELTQDLYHQLQLQVKQQPHIFQLSLHIHNFSLLAVILMSMVSSHFNLLKLFLFQVDYNFKLHFRMVSH